jgi:hypothetical protein
MAVVPAVLCAIETCPLLVWLYLRSFVRFAVVELSRSERGRGRGCGDSCAGFPSKALPAKLLRAQRTSEMLQITPIWPVFLLLSV